MKKVISISVWGNDPRYIEGSKKNALLAEKHYPEWEYWIYAEEHLHPLLKNTQAKIFSPPKTINNGRFWRFLPAFDDSVDIMISRDSDSRISQREVRCVEEWLKTNKKYHIIRDHERHYDFPVLGGMWGIRGTPIVEKNSIFQFSSDKNAYLVDQIWLAKKMWQEIQHDVCIHGYKEIEWMKNTRPPLDFIGQGYNENDIPIYK